MSDDAIARRLDRQANKTCLSGVCLGERRLKDDRRHRESGDADRDKFSPGNFHYCSFNTQPFGSMVGAEPEKFIEPRPSFISTR